MNSYLKDGYNLLVRNEFDFQSLIDNNFYQNILSKIAEDADQIDDYFTMNVGYTLIDVAVHTSERDGESYTAIDITEYNSANVEFANVSFIDKVSMADLFVKRRVYLQNGEQFQAYLLDLIKTHPVIDYTQGE